MKAFYNEFDPKAAAWLRELIGMGLIHTGFVDERSITEVQGSDLGSAERVHWFAGIGGWDYALQLAGWPDDRPVWTASLPCQPFSVAGKRLGKQDERHLLPHFLELVAECKPPVIFGEQVPDAIRHGWLDDLCDEMGREGYTVRAAVLTAAGIGAPHIRRRLYWVAYSDNSRREAESSELRSRILGEAVQSGECRVESGDLCSISSGVGHTSVGTQWAHKREPSEGIRQQESFRGYGVFSQWSGSEWIPCRDGKLRPIKPGIKPLVNGVSRGMVRGGDKSMVETGAEENGTNNTQEARVMRLRGYGNAIVPQVAAAFIHTVEDEIGGLK